MIENAQKRTTRPRDTNKEAVRSQRTYRFSASMCTLVRGTTVTSQPVLLRRLDYCLHRCLSSRLFSNATTAHSLPRVPARTGADTVDGADVAAYAAGELFLTKTIENATEKAEDGESESRFSFFKDPWEQGVWVLHLPINIKNGQPTFGFPPPLCKFVQVIVVLLPLIVSFSFHAW